MLACDGKYCTMYRCGTRVVWQKLSYLSAYRNVLSVCSQQFIPGEIIAICIDMTPYHVIRCLRVKYNWNKVLRNNETVWNCFISVLAHWNRNRTIRKRSIILCLSFYISVYLNVLSGVMLLVGQHEGHLAHQKNRVVESVWSEIQTSIWSRWRHCHPLSLLQ